MSAPQQTLAEWLRAAYADPAAGCPPPEAWLPEELQDLDPEARAALLAHAESCPACAAERDLAAAFDATPDAVASREDIDWVVQRLAATSTAVAPIRTESPAPLSFPRERSAAERAASPATAAGIPPTAKVVPFPGRRLPSTLIGLAAAAALAMAVGITYRTALAPNPPLPEPPSRGAVRGGMVEVLSPLGEVATAPAELRWTAVAGASAYRVRLLTVDGRELWAERVTDTVAAVPAAVQSQLRAAVAYPWEVEALGADGRSLARSQGARFRLAPTATPGSPAAPAPTTP